MKKTKDKNNKIPLEITQKELDEIRAKEKEILILFKNLEKNQSKTSKLEDELLELQQKIGILRSEIPNIDKIQEEIEKIIPILE